MMRKGNKCVVVNDVVVVVVIVMLHPRVCVYKQRSERGIDGRENCEENAEAPGGFISGRGRGGKVRSG